MNKNRCIKVIKIAPLCLVFFLSACGTTNPGGNPVASGPKIYTGPSAYVGPAEIGLHLNTEGEWVVEGGASVPIAEIPEVAGINWDIGFEYVLNQAQGTQNYLYLMWEYGDGTIYQQAYNIGKPFNITFEYEQWVRRISSTGDGNIIVQIEIRDMGAETFPCSSYSMNTRLSPGMNARVTITENHLTLRIRTLPITETSTYITSLSEDTSMRIVDGPACNEGWIWWNVSTENGFTGWVSEGDGSTWFIEPE